jgi:hypothetical protein
MKAGTWDGEMPAKVFDRARAIVMAGFANEVDEVNQYAAPIQAATIQGASSALRWPRTTSKRPRVATNSAIHWAMPVRS